MNPLSGPGIDRERIEAAVTELLNAIGEDPARDGLAHTPSRVAEAYAEFFSGLHEDPLVHLAQSIPLRSTRGSGEADAATTALAMQAAGGSIGGTSDAVLLRDIAFRSVCEHHLLPFLGVAHIAYLPADRVVGLGRLPRVVNTLASRPQVQERLTEEIADALQTGLEPRGVLVVLDAVHGCVTARGTRQSGSSTVTIASRGELTDPVARAEIVGLIGAAEHGQ
ncbi:MAG: GTP cyclohydrolase I [Microbacteriaceae bacterium]